MNFKDLFGSLKRNSNQRSQNFKLTMLLAVSCVVMAFGLINKQPVVILVPPDLSQESEIASNNASAEVKKAWGLMVANLVGNVSPGNVGFVERSLKGVLDPALYHELLESIQEEALVIKDGQITVTFVPSDVTYQASKNKVYVSGETTKKGPFSEPVRGKKTFEFEIVVRNYRPYVATWKAYVGGPRIDHQPQNPQESHTEESPPGAPEELETLTEMESQAVIEPAAVMEMEPAANKSEEIQ